MIKKNEYTPQNHPTENNMNMGTQVAKLYGMLNIAVKKEEEPEIDYNLLILDGNGVQEDLKNNEIFDGNVD